MSGILLFTPSNLVDLLFNFQRLEVVKLGLVRLELGVELVLAALFLSTSPWEHCVNIDSNIVE